MLVILLHPGQCTTVFIMDGISQGLCKSGSVSRGRSNFQLFGSMGGGRVSLCHCGFGMPELDIKACSFGDGPGQGNENILQGLLDLYYR